MIREEFLGGKITLYGDDCLRVLDSLSENSVDSVVCDPPYHLTQANRSKPAPFVEGSPFSRHRVGFNGDNKPIGGFMGKEWDGGDIAFQPETWVKVAHVLKPGGHLVAFGAPKNYHRLACAIEDAGFEIRDSLMWVFGSGFPKSLDVSKAIDKARSEATAAAAEWQGWGTALKPAYEPIVLARKPLSEKTVAANVLKWATGALNIDATRVGDFQNTTPPGTDRYNKANFEQGYRPSAYGRDGEASAERRYTEKGSTNFAPLPGTRGGSPAGRWPANLAHDGSEEVLAGFPETKSGAMRREVPAYDGDNVTGFLRGRSGPDNQHGDSGSAARFFYQAKASAKDRADSKHPTVKPVALIRWLVRMVTPPGGTVLDPFAGTGTTGQAALEEGFRALLIEREIEYIKDICRRIDLATPPTPDQYRLFEAAE
jgi:site-specific DNA-methyltransferase (adenine-specific)